MKQGDKVDYHSIIGGPVTKPGLVMKSDPFKASSGDMVAFVEGVSGYVSMDALTPAADQ
jgi:hypothetical protein